ncbi:MAG: DUF2341 domain-containing protein [Patescibacteria group bacterium]|nr:DUF2341 domain-containing protein [Patescibacteria group bacterium]
MHSKAFQLLLILTIAIVFCVTRFVCASGLTWEQNNWLGGSGQSSWSDDTKYDSTSGLSATSTGLILQTKNNWYDASWKYRQSVSITNNADSDLNNYQIPIYINTAQLISDSKMASDCNDIRVVDVNGNVLPTWIATAPTANSCNHTATKLWVKLSLLPVTGTSLYIYYGNNEAAAVSNGQDVFSIFADFTSGSSLPSGWTKTDIGTAGSATVGGGVLSISNVYGEDVWQSSYGATHAYSTSTVSNGFVAEALINSQTGSSEWAKTGITVQNTVASGGGNGQAFIVTTPGNGIAFQYQSLEGELCSEGSCPGVVAPNLQTNGGSYSFPLFLKLTKDNSKEISGYYSANGSSWSKQGNTEIPWGATDTQYVTLFVTPHLISGSSTATYSFFYVRSYSDSEPTVSTPQNEEGSYTSSGTLTSSIFDTGSASDFGSVSFSYATTTNTSVTLKIRTSNNADMTGASAFSSCDSITSGADISVSNCVQDRQRYIQYQVALTSGDGLHSPKLEDFSLTYASTPTYTLNYQASSGGYISGLSTQTVYYGDDGSSVTATPNSGYYFSGWDDGCKEKSRTETNVKSNFSAVANFVHSPSSSFTPPSTPKISVEPLFTNNTINWSVTNVYQMAISENADFSKSSWVPYEDSYKQTDKNLYIKFRSPDGGESKVYVIPPKEAEEVVSQKQAAAPIKLIPVPKESIASTKPINPAKQIPSKQIFNFKKDLKLGMEAPDVEELQKFLNSNGFLIAAKGIGSPGNESNYFGRMTSAALARFQKANNISPAIGVFGPITRKAITKLTN